jgi:phosphate transport system substrate-binding protein
MAHENGDDVIIETFSDRDCPMLDQKMTSPPKRPKPWVLFLSILSAQILTLVAFSPQAIQAQSSTEVPATFSLPESLPADAKIQIDGSSSMSVINQSLVQRFEQKFPGAKVATDIKGTDAALSALDQGLLDIAAISRPLKPEETAKGLVSIPVSREKIAIVVAKDNPFQGNITFEQFAKIFRGEISDWSELGGAPGSIKFVDRPTTSDTRQAFQGYPVFQQAAFEAGPNATTLSEDSTDVMAAELGTNGIGYAVASQVINRPDVRVISMHQTSPDDPRYPFSQTRSYVYKGSPNPAVQAFLAFATSPEGKEAVSTATTNNPTDTTNPAGGGSPSPTADATASPTASPTVALVPDADTASANTQGGGGAPWWPWLLLPVAAGGLIWALGRGKKGAPTPVVPPDEERIRRPLGGVAPVPPPVVDTDSPTALSERPPVAGDTPFAAGAAAVGRAATGATAAGVAAVGAAAAGVAAVGAAAMGRSGSQSRIILTSRDPESAYAYWEVPEAEKAAARRQGVQKMELRLHDVTGIADLDRQPPHSTQQFDCPEDDQDLHLPIPQNDRDYQAEIGYTTEDGQWLSLARSNRVRFPARPLAAGATTAIETDVFDDTAASTTDALDADWATAPDSVMDETDETGTRPDWLGDAVSGVGDTIAGVGGAVAGMGSAATAGLGGAAAAAAAGLGSMADRVMGEERSEVPAGEEELTRIREVSTEAGFSSRIILSPRNAEHAYVYWEVPEQDKAVIRRVGGRKAALRIYDVTDIPDMDRQSPHSVQQYDWDEISRDRHVSVPAANRDYVAELGYETLDGRWLRLARSLSVRVPEPTAESGEWSFGDDE